MGILNNQDPFLIKDDGKEKEKQKRTKLQKKTKKILKSKETKTRSGERYCSKKFSTNSALLKATQPFIDPQPGGPVKDTEERHYYLKIVIGIMFLPSLHPSFCVLYMIQIENNKCTLNCFWKLT